MTGAVGGELPSIVVAGSGEPGDPYDLSLNDAWAAAVAAQLSTTSTAVNALGVKGVAKASDTDQNGITARVDITGLSVTWTALANRVYRYTLNVNVSKAASADAANVLITTGTGFALIQRTTIMQVGDISTVQIVWTETVSAGSTTRKAQIETPGGTCNVVNSFTRNGILIVEDIGPA